MNFYIYDLETMYNCFLFTGKFVGDNRIYTFEISSRKNQRDELLAHLGYLRNCGVFMVGYNSLQFDYPIIHQFLTSPYTFDYKTAYNLAQQIIKSQEGFGFERLRFNERYLPQIDLLKIHHFDNPSKRTSLKALQFAMRSHSVEDLPFPFDTDLTHEQMDLMIVYNVHDVTETENFFEKSRKVIFMRKELLDNGIISGDVLNYSDVKIGTEYLIKKIGRSKCFLSGSKPRQTIRHSVAIRDVILPTVSFRTEEFNAVHEWFNQQIVYFAKGAERPKLSTTLAGIVFDFGVGGVHASVKSRVYESTETHSIMDVDVSGMYVAVAIANGFYPEHLGTDFVTAYRQLQSDRSQHPKGTTMNLVLKLAGNGASGNFENEYSPLFDRKCAYSIRINGQLQLIQLAERLASIPGLELIQANTDGITAYMPREMEPFFRMWCEDWEALTKLKLEYAEYSKMFIRDVNNYIAVDTKGKIKRKGAYWYPITEEDYHGSSGSNWNKDFSNLTAQKGAEACMIYGYQPEDVVRLFSNPFDFMLRYKTPGGAKLYIGDEEQQRTVRYYVSKNGQPMKKIAMPKGKIGDWKRRNGLKDADFDKIMATLPPGAWDERVHTKNKSKYQAVTTSVESGRLVKQCNNMDNFRWDDVDFDFYAQEIRKLIIGANNV